MILNVYIKVFLPFTNNHKEEQKNNKKSKDPDRFSLL